MILESCMSNGVVCWTDGFTLVISSIQLTTSWMSWRTNLIMCKLIAGKTNKGSVVAYLLLLSPTRYKLRLSWISGNELNKSIIPGPIPTTLIIFALEGLQKYLRPVHVVCSVCFLEFFNASTYIQFLWNSATRNRSTPPKWNTRPSQGYLKAPGWGKALWKL